VHLTKVKASGVDYRQRRRLLPGETSRAPLSELPPIPELLDTPGARPGPPGPPKPPRQPWTVLANGITCDLEELWIDRFRLEDLEKAHSGLVLPRCSQSYANSANPLVNSSENFGALSTLCLLTSHRSG
jgi:hypothetical protein